MSIPNFPQDMIRIDWEQALSMVVASIAMEELALSHILNAEGEKLQYVLGTLHKEQPHCTSVQDILRVNESVGGILEKVETNQILLKGKLEQAIKASQRQEKKTAIYQGKPGYCWCKGVALPWVSEGEQFGCPVNRILLDANATCLVSYSFSLELTTGERNVAILMQIIRGSQRETLVVEEAHPCYREMTVSLCGCVVVPAQEGCSSEIEFLLSLPSCVSVKRASLTVTTL